jgi:dolichol-phosphate mannosyltransferase
MHKGHRIIAVVPAHNEQGKIGRVVERTDFSIVDTLLVVDDGSTDDTAAVARAKGAQVLSLYRREGVGAALRSGIEYGRQEGVDIRVIMAGNNKDDPSEIPRLVDPICDDGCDFVVGSRYAAGGKAGGDMPWYRKVATRLHPWLMGRFAGKRLTESTNGFRAFRLELLDDRRINLHQRWLNTYGLEVYLLWKVLKLGYRHQEVPCTKVYPDRSMGYTKMKPIVGWWSILRPVFLLGLGFKR